MLMLTTSAALFSQEDCDLFNIQELSAAYLNFSVDTVILQFDGSYEIQLSNGTTASITFGCTDSDYLEYNAAANTDDGSCATLVVEGCTDPAYTEYNAAANTDDGSCATLVVEGCTDPAYTEYNAAANTDDGSCSTAVVEGCTDTAYLEYNAAANTDDGSCITPVVEGCTDPADVNYDAAANTDDGSCASACTDVEMNGHTYAVVEIGDQCWFAENLRTTVYGNGDVIPAGLTWWEWTSTTAGATAVYGEGSSNCQDLSPEINACNEAQSLAAYGRLYNWYAVDDARGLCPAGWHVPTDGEWTALKTYLGANGHSGAEGTALKSTTGWSNNGNGTDDFGFSALPGGNRSFNVGYFFAAGDFGNWWSSSPSGGNAWNRYLSYYYPGVFRDDLNPRYGFSVRCLRYAVVNGCTDPAYTEYDALATYDDGSCATAVVNGCTDPAYVEYDASANTNDGSCQNLLGCIDPAYIEFNPAASADDGSCATAVVNGCTDPAYTEYDASANTDDGSCQNLLGCIDPAYIEFNPAAFADDGSCTTPVVNGCTDPAYTEYDALANTDDGSCTTPVVNGCTDPAYTEYNAAANTDDGSCATLVVEGCTDPAYTEYNAAANTDDGSCSTAVVEGCTDTAYLEYNAAANTDDGSCITPVVEGCTDPADVNYDAAANTDDGSCASACTDVEMNGHTYAVVEIDDQCWFAENLRTTVYGNGDVIPAGLTDGAWTSTTAGATAVYGEGSSGCQGYSPVIDACDEAQSLAAYGRLYNWYAVDDARGLCPAGWHVPTDGEWTELEDYITSQGFAGTEGTALKSTTGWSNNGNGTNDFGFSALPGGLRSIGSGNFSDAGVLGFWWSSSPYGGNAWLRSLLFYNLDVNRNDYAPRYGFSVRCLRDAD